LSFAGGVGLGLGLGLGLEDVGCVSAVEVGVSATNLPRFKVSAIVFVTSVFDGVCKFLSVNVLPTIFEIWSAVSFPICTTFWTSRIISVTAGFTLSTASAVVFGVSGFGAAWCN